MLTFKPPKQPFESSVFQEGLIVTVIKNGGRSHQRSQSLTSGIVRHNHTMTPLSLFTPDDRDVRGVDSHLCPHDCGQQKKQQCCEMEPSSCWGNWDRKWGSAWGHGIQTQQSEDFVFPTIPYSPSRSCCHTRTHMHTRPNPFPTPRSFIPWRWECDINQSVPTTPVTPTVSAAPPPILAAPSPPLLPSVCHSGATATPKTHCSERWTSTRKEGQREGLSEPRRERRQTWSPARTRVLTDMGIWKNLDAINYHSAHLKQRGVTFMYPYLLRGNKNGSGHRWAG